MSDDDSRDSRDKTVNGDAGDKDSICRDFLRNVCRRGRRCKYRHPEPGEAEELGRKIEYVFCHDYQNKECRRSNCKFIHCTREEEEYYRTSGDLPQHVLDAVAMGKGLNQEAQGPQGEVPVCKDFLKGDCRRGGRCKFRHLNANEYEMEVGVPNRRRERFDQYDRFDDFEQYDPLPKRRHLDDYGCVPGGVAGGVGVPSMAGVASMTGVGAMMGVRQPPPMPPMAPDHLLFEEENSLLRRKVEELKKQVSDLVATNEFLLGQNAQLRMGKQAAPNSMTNPTPVPMPMSSDMAPGPPGTMQAQLGSGAPIVPVSLAGPGMAPVSIAPVSIAPVSLSTQAMPTGSMPQSIAMSMSGPTTPLVSYPIMTQSMRPNLSQSSLAH